MTTHLRIGMVFAGVLLWKLGLLLAGSLPPPANDSFFYDGAAVNYLRNGLYANPSISLALPISGTQVFSAYPPLYQWGLLPWMWLFGTSELSAMFFHLLLFSIYAWIACAILTRLACWAGTREEAPGTSAADVSPAVAKAHPRRRGPFHLAALFLLAITFHDRPDSLAHVFGLAAVYTFVRFLEPGTARAWSWLMVAFAVLALCTGLQIGALYLAVLWVGTIAAHLAGRARFPWLAMAATLLIPALLCAWIVMQYPLLWQGFLEHARLTPAITGLRMPRFDELLKIGRAAPGIFVVAVLGALAIWRKTRGSSANPEHADPAAPGVQAVLADPLLVFLVATALPALGLLGAAMFFVTPNAGSFTMYVQPVIVGACLLWAGAHFGSVWSGRATLVLAIFAGFAAIRAAGLSTWGLACAADCSRGEALALVREAIDTPGEGTIVLSSAYLYEASRWPGKAVHCDWLQRPGPDQLVSDLEGLMSVKPRQLLLTQFDYYRRYEPLLAALQEKGAPVTCTVTNRARLPTPDSIPPLRRVLQHISWAPVIITLEWHEPVRP